MAVFLSLRRLVRVLAPVAFVLSLALTSILQVASFAQEATPILSDPLPDAIAPDQSHLPTGAQNQSPSEIEVLADGSDLVLSYNGNTGNISVEPGTTMSFIVTGDIMPPVMPGTLEIRTGTCQGTTVQNYHEYLFSPPPYTYSHTFSQMGTFGVMFTGMQQASNCLIVTVGQEAPALTSSGLTSEIATNLNTSVPFNLASFWPAGATDVSYTVSSVEGNSCTGTTIATHTFTEIPASSVDFDYSFTSPGRYAVQGAWGAFSSDCILVNVATPNVVILSNGSADPVTINMYDTVEFNLASIWPAGATDVSYTISAVEDETCSGTLLKTITLNDVPAGSVDFSISFDTPGTFAVQGAWGAFSSECILVTVPVPTVTLVSDGSTDPLTTNMYDTIEFNLASIWPAGATDVAYTITSVEDETCTGTLLESITLDDVPAGSVDFSITFDTPGTFAVQGAWGAFSSDCILVTVPVPTASLVSGGSTEPLTVSLNDELDFTLASIWPAGATDVEYTITSVEDETCTGTLLETITLDDVPAGSVDFSITFDTPGTFAVQGAWGAYSSDCIIVTVPVPTVTLVSNGSVAPLTINMNDAVDFNLASIWPAGATDVAYTITSVEDETCTGTLLETITLDDVPAGSVDFSISFDTPGTFAVQGAWGAYSSDCIFVTVSQPVVPSGTPTPTPSPTTVPTSTASPTSTPSPTETVPSTPDVQTPEPTATIMPATPDAATPAPASPSTPVEASTIPPTSPALVVDSLPKTGTGLSAGFASLLLGLVFAITLISVGVLRKRT